MLATTATRIASLQDWRRSEHARHVRWLTPLERAELRHWRDARRREAWLAGRWISKSLLADRVIGVTATWSQIEILSLDDQQQSVRAKVRSRSRTWNGSLSISHSGDAVMAVVSESPTVRVGCDLHNAQDPASSLVEFWFSPQERRSLARTPNADNAIHIWIAKEAFYKALNDGEPFAPRQFDIQRQEGGWRCVYRGVEVDGECTIRRLRIGKEDYFAACVGVRVSPAIRR